MSLLRWALVFFVVALVAALFGFGNIAQGAADIGRILFFVFLAVCVLFAIIGMAAARSVT